MKYNKENPNDKIRIISISKGYNEGDEGFELWRTTLEEAKKSGLIIIHSFSGYEGIGCPLDKDRDDPKNYDLCNWEKKYIGKEKIESGAIYIPVDNRTIATMSYRVEGVIDDEKNNVNILDSGSRDQNNYCFSASGSHSLASPYLAGVIALGLQVDPDLKEDDIWKYIKETGTPFNRGRIINPKGFVDRVKLELKNRTQKVK